MKHDKVNIGLWMDPTLVLDKGLLCTHLYFQAAQQNFTLEENYNIQNSIDFVSHNSA